MDPEPPVPRSSPRDTQRLPDEAIDAFVATAGPEADSPLLLAELRHLGGALGRAPENAGALDKLDAEYVMLGIGMLMDPAMREPIEGQLDKLHDALGPWEADGGYYNYAERPCDVEGRAKPLDRGFPREAQRTRRPHSGQIHSIAMATA